MTRVFPYFAFAALCLLATALLPAPVARAQAGAKAVRDAGVRLLGAARGYATAALWLRAGDAYARGDLHETAAMYHVIRELQPRNPAVYSFQSWNEGYNISAQFPYLERRTEWVTRGLKTLHTGQKLLPHESSLLLDEWHYLLNRTRGYPLEVLRAELAQYGARDRAWGQRCEAILNLEPRLDDTQRAQMREFLDERGMQVDLHEMESFTALDEAVRGLLALANWARWHCMALVLEPVLAIKVRSLSCDIALAASYYHAYKAMPPQLEDELAEIYRQGARRAVKAGIENARRIFGEKGVDEFVERQRENFRDLPGWLD